MKKPAFDLKDIRIAVKTIKTAILRSRYMAARKANFEHLKLYFYVGAYVSANSRNGTWGTGAIAAISERLSQELPGLRGFSSTNIKNMRIFFEQWAFDINRQLSTDDLKAVVSAESLPEIRQLSTGELTESDMAAFFSIGFTHHMEIIFKCRSQAERWYYIRKTAMEFWNVEDLKRRIRARDYAVNGKAINNFGLTIPYSMPLGVATYRTSEDVPPAYKALKPLLDGSQKLLVEMTSENSVSPRKSKMKKGGGK